MKKLTAVVALMAVYTLAMCFVLIGSISTELMDRLSIDKGELGTMVFSMFLTAMIVQIFIGPLVDKLGYKIFAITGFIVVSASTFLMALANTFPLAVLASVFLGIGAICLNTVGNTLLPVVLFEGKDPARAGNFGNGFFGLGLVLTPWIITGLKQVGMASTGSIIVLGVIVLVFLIFGIIASYPQVATGYEISMFFKLLPQAAVIVAALALFCYMSLEQTMSTWLKPYLTEVFESEDTAGFFFGFFGICIMAGRFAVSAIKNITAIGTKLIVGVCVLAMIAIGLLITTESPVVSVIAVVLIGFAFAPIFPTVVGVTFSKYEPRMYGTIFGIIFAVGLLGSMTLPKVIGNVAEDKGFKAAFPIAIGMAAVLLIIGIIMGQLRGKPEKAEQQAEGTEEKDTDDQGQKDQG
ncbi:MAG: MFS transporter [Verrucomicrobia bacterium]|nr:MFS transporter [Verrucomicrobiota bacterium]MCF7708005.1 MFS transporter [Verrucomicrobiota bacterium]